MQFDLLVKTWPEALGNGKGISILVLVRVFREGAADCISPCTTLQNANLSLLLQITTMGFQSSDRYQNLSNRYTKASLHCCILTTENKLSFNMLPFFPFSAFLTF